MINYISNKVTKALGLIALTGLSSLMNSQNMNWSPAGPIYNAGRVRNIVIDKTDGSGKTIYAGSTSSGVFKTTDGGVSWAPLDDQGPVKNISYMAQANDYVIYAGTGEGFLRPGQLLKAQPGTGLYKLSGSALTLVAPSSMVGTVINRIACSPLNAAVIVLATNKGIMISNNSGQSFAPAVGITPNPARVGMDVKFDNAGILYCSVGNEKGTSPTFTAIASEVYKSTDASLTNFVNRTPTSSILANLPYGRIELAISPSNNQVIYASCAKKSNSNLNSATLLGLFVSYDGGTSWGLVLQGSPALDPLSNGSTVASGDYAHTILVNPSNSDELFVGGYAFYMFKRTGGLNSSPTGTWTPIGNNTFATNTPYYLHENIHDIKILNTTPVKFYFVTDAGIYRSIDMTTASIFSPPSFQPFYKGLVTGQFNSVSIETFPLVTTPTAVNIPGTVLSPYFGFIGGTGGNGLNYFSGTSNIAAQETNYLGGEVYNTELSKILPGAAILTTANGGLYRSTNVKNSDPTLLNYNAYTGALSRVAPSTNPFIVGGIVAGTPFKLWENYGNIPNGPDAVVFYNDTLRAQASMVGLATLTTQSTFTFSAPRPNTSAIIDSIVIRTATVALPVAANAASVTTPFSGNDRKDIYINISNTFVPTGTLSTPPITIVGPSALTASVTLNSVTNLDNISVTFTGAPFFNKTTPFYPTTATGTNIIVTDPAAYYRVFATVYYKYKAGDVISIPDNNISTISSTYTTALTQSLDWRYGNTSTAYTITAPSNSAVSNPTYVLNPGNVTQSTPDFTVYPVLTTTYSISTFGTYSVSGTPVIYTLTAVTNTNVTGTTYTYALNPGNVTVTTASTSTTAVTFTVSPAVNTTYTITQTGSAGGTLTGITTSVVNTSTYILTPGNISQSTPDFTIAVTAPTAYTINGVSSNTLIGDNTVKAGTLGAPTTSILGSSIVPFAQNNPTIKITQKRSARLALMIDIAGVTGPGPAVVVSKSPLNLNDPLNFVRLSQNGCLTTNPDGTPATSITSTIAIPGKATILEWSKSGTELYYATDDQKLYRVSYINLIMDFSPASYSGKLSTDIFNYIATGNGGLSSVPNLNSPYRTTLLGTFNKPITSISIASNDQSILLTFDDPTGVPAMYSNAPNLKMLNASNINFVAKTGTGFTSTSSNGVKTYCSMMEKNDPKQVFIGTDNGIYYTSDITAASPTWANVNNNQLPNVQVFDIEQQTMDNASCYNSGQIYVATNGRGVWSNTKYFTSPYVVSVDEIEKAKAEKNISIFPNPTNGSTSIVFDGIDGESAIVNVFDLSGRLVKTETLGKLNSEEVSYTLETTDLNSGIYIVNINSTSNIKRVAKLIITK